MREVFSGGRGEGQIDPPSHFRVDIFLLYLPSSFKRQTTDLNKIFQKIYWSYGHSGWGFKTIFGTRYEKSGDTFLFPVITKLSNRKKWTQFPSWRRLRERRRLLMGMTKSCLKWDEKQAQKLFRRSLEILLDNFLCLSIYFLRFNDWRMYLSRNLQTKW